MRSFCYSLVSFCVMLSLIAALSPAAFAQIPANDECSGATVIGPLPYTASQNTRLATPNLSDPVLLCADSGGGKTVWYTYTADSTRYIRFTTARSTPADYDIAMGLYTGVCGSLVEADCNDDIVPGTVRQAEITYQVVAGTTYIIQIAEWKGGGPSGHMPTGGSLVLDVSVAGPPPPLTQGPKSGSVASGAIVSTNSFEIQPVAGHLPVEQNEREVAAENEGQDLLPTPPDVMPPKGPPGSNFMKMNSPEGIQNVTSRPVVIKNFSGNVPTGFIPPDPIMAVGPNHIIGVVNSNFRIWDKNGTLLKDIPMSSWFASVKSPVGFSDPQIFYDHFAHRWVIGGGGFAAPYTFLLSVSDDDNPLGTWYNWSLPSGLGDSVTGNLPDYPQMGFDDTAIYITSREFHGSFKYSRCRIIGKAQLYANTAGPVAWNDFWDFREPQHPGIALDGIRPSMIYGHPAVHFLVNASPYGTGTFFSLWTIHDPLGSPSITGTNIPVVQYGAEPPPNQLSGGTVFDIGSSSTIRHKAVYRDSSLWFVHSIANPSDAAHSALHVVRSNPFTHVNLEDVAMGQTGYWHFYSALMVDANKNTILTFTRSGDNEYAGAYLAGHRDSDPPGISPSVSLKPGVAHYEALGAGRNRWGDYNGIALDPDDTSAIWVNSEYASATDNWGTWIAKTKMAPVPGKYMFIDPSAINFPNREVGTAGDTQAVSISSFGFDSLTVTSITVTDSNFQIVSVPGLPLKLGLYDVAAVKVVASPKVVGQTSGTVVVAGNDSINPAITINLNGSGYIVHTASPNSLYASSGTIPPNGRLLSLDKFTGSATLIGQTGYDEIVSLRVHPATHELMGIASSGAKNNLVRINSTAADAHPYVPSSLPAVSLVKGMAYHGDTLYFGRINGLLYRMDPVTGVSAVVASTGIQIGGIDFNPVTGVLWASTCPYGGCGVKNNNIYKISLPSGAKTLVGNAGLASPILDIAFDAIGNLFAIVGTNPSSIAVIDTANGVATIFGTLGIQDAKALAFSAGATVPSHSFDFDSSWNLLSVPVTVENYSKSALFPSAASKAFIYSGRYAEAETLKNGVGFWLKYTAKQTFSIVGEELGEDTIPVAQYWNLIGSISHPIPTTLLSSIPPGIITSAYYTYQGSGYLPDDSIKPGLGYWVKTNSSGQIVLNSPSIEPNAVAANFTAAAPAEFSSVIFRDDKGHAQPLYFGKAKDGLGDANRYELPPRAPFGGFDVRFASNRILELHPAMFERARAFPVAISSDAPSLRVEWNIVADQTVRYKLTTVNGTNGKVSTYVMRGAGSAVLMADGYENVRVSAEPGQIPMTYSLKQNYPNPFNPTTRIRYELPATEHVTLSVFDILGKEVARLIDETQEGGYYEVPFSGEHLSSGVYFYRLIAGKFTSVQKMMIVK